MDNYRRMSDYDREWNKSQQLLKNEQQLAQGFSVADIYLNRTYLDKFSLAPIIQPNRSIMDATKIRMIEIDKLVFDSHEKFLDKLMSVYSALYNLGSTVALVLNSDGNTTKLYMGIRSEENISVSLDVMQSTLKGNFPGIKIETLDMKKINEKIDFIKNSDTKSVSSISVVPSDRSKSNNNIENYVQGLEKFIDTMNGKVYTMICIASPIDNETIQKRKHGYEELCSTLSPHSKLSLTYGKNESIAVNESISSSFSQSVNRSVSNSNSTNTSHSSGSNSSYSNGSNFNGNFSGDGASFGWGSNSSQSNGSFDSYTSGSAFTRSISDSEGSTTSDSTTKGETSTTGTSNTVTLNFENKGVELLMKRAQAQLDRLKIGESFGMWEFSNYILSKDIHTTVLAGNSYKALMIGNESNIESAHINIWSINQINSINRIIDSISYFVHPCAEMPAFDGTYQKQLVTPTNMISGNELPMVMSLPKKSISGLPVVEMAEFGRSVVYENNIPDRSISFGNIYHMGVVEKSRVNMNLDLLSSHCFITGSSGSGKSYATYQLLQSVLDNDVKMMIVEPAKGEYKQIFGGLKGIKIYTTDTNSYRILKINPFQFPENIHLLSHIEQLLQIFNASWPLYAAMPAILKEAVVEAYIKCGWDVQNSIWISGFSDHKYPVFSDVLEILQRIINESEYSADSKGDYKGALVTRVQSMTVGINGLIFKNSEGIDDYLLFDSNIIVDLSELGSDESIALIMGVLIMKLNEYRKSQRKSSNAFKLNSGLKHITVLEEAHNLLKRTSKDQNQEGANMVGKSVEMISNSIKEMRTYGEGFIIIDQSPMAVDSSAIENTSTKIIMNTPAKDACEELGSALSLNENQTKELSRLNVGVAAVFQKGWLSPVLMKIDKWDDRYEIIPETVDNSELRNLRGKIAYAIVSQKTNGKISPMKLRTFIKASTLPNDKKRELEEVILSYNDKLTSSRGINKYYFGNLLIDIIGCDYLFKVIPKYGIPTYNEFSSYDSDSDEFAIFIQEFESSVTRWFEDMFNALKKYVSIDDENVLSQIIIEMLYPMGHGGMVRYYKNDKMAMICRMLYKMLNIPLFEGEK